MSIFEHFRKEEHPFIERTLEWLEQVEQHHDQKLTDFLDPRQIYIMKAMKAKYPQISVTAYGGFSEAERCRTVICQDYYTPQTDDFGLTAFQVTSTDSSLVRLKHKDFLGTLLGIGIRRDKFGDILLHPEFAQFLAAKEISAYVRSQIQQIHRVSVVLEEIPLSNLCAMPQKWKETVLTVPSTRADVVVGDVFHLSRSKAAMPIHAGYLKVNWMVVDTPSFLVKEGDIVSLRGYGRFKVIREEGVTKKGSIRLQIGILL